jgi:hypothetical protein
VQPHARSDINRIGLTAQRRDRQAMPTTHDGRRPNLSDERSRRTVMWANGPIHGDRAERSVALPEAQEESTPDESLDA